MHGLVGVLAVGLAGAASAQVVPSQLSVRARASLAANVGPVMRVMVDGVAVGAIEVRATTWQAYSFAASVGPESRVDVVFTNDTMSGSEDRNLFVLDVTIGGATYASSRALYDRGFGLAAFDGFDVLPGQTAMWWNGALRFVQPTAALADFDRDQVPDTVDNCVTVVNPHQHDVNANGVGDACDGDLDGDRTLTPADRAIITRLLTRQRVELVTTRRYDLNEDGIVDETDVGIVQTIIRNRRGACFLGDVNCDSVINQADFDLIRARVGRVLRTPDPAKLVRADYVRDGTIDQTDLAEVTRLQFDYRIPSVADFDQDGVLGRNDFWLWFDQPETQRDVNRDGIVDWTDSQIMSAVQFGRGWPGDVDLDSVVGPLDITFVTANLGVVVPADEELTARCDLNGDQIITSADEVLSAAQFREPMRADALIDGAIDEHDVEQIRTGLGEGWLVGAADLDGSGVVDAADLVRFDLLRGRAPPLTGFKPGARAWRPEQVAVLVNDNDPASVALAEYYRVRRNIPLSNVVHVRLPTSNAVTLAQFNAARSVIDAATPPWVQAFAVAWLAPYRVDQLSLTHVLSRAQPFTTAPTYVEENPLYSGWRWPFRARYPESAFAWHRDRVRPAMMLAARTLDDAKALVERGISADGTRPTGRALVMVTSDSVRSLRADSYPTNMLGTVISSSVNVVKHAGNSFSGTTDTLFTFHGLAQVPSLANNRFPPGAIVDNLTSFGGRLLDSNGQTSILDFISWGATASFGTVVEPFAIAAKFPEPEVAVRRYTSGLTLLQAYWGSVSWTEQGLFVGEPLANPWR